MANDKDLKIGISTEYNGEGAKQALADTEKLKQAAEAAAEATAANNGSPAAGSPQESGESEKQAAEAAKEAAAARREATAAMQTEQNAAAELANAMRLESMSKKELQAESLKLSKARAEAAKAQDVKTYTALEKQSAQVKKRLGEVNKEGQLNKLVTIGQAQAGMQAAESFRNLTAGVQDGSLSVGDMVTQVISLATTMKSALGPIGWVMMAIQGLQMAVSAYSNAQKEAAEAQKKFTEAAKEQQKNVAEHAERQQQRELDAYAEATEKQIAELDRRREAELQDFDAREAIRKSNAQAELAELTESINQQIAVREQMAKDKKISQAELATFRATKAEELRIATQAAEEVGTAAGEKRLKIEKKYANELVDVRKKEADSIADSFRGLTDEWADRDSEGVAEILRNIDNLKDRRDTAKKTIENINKEMDALKDQGRHWYGNDKEITARVNALRKERADVEAQRLATEKQIGEVEFSAYMQYKALLDLVSLHKETEGMTIEDKLKYARDVQKRGKVAKDALKDAEREREAIHDAAILHDNDAENQKKINKAKATTARAAEENAKHEAAKTDREKAIADGFQDIENSTKLIGSYSTKDARSEEEIAEADKNTLEEKLERLRKLQVTPGLDEKTYKKLNKAVDDTLKAQQAIDASLRKSAISKMNKDIERSLSKLLDNTKTTGTYEEEDKRTRRQILEADKKRLAEREKELRAMRAAGNLDPSLAEKIDKELREVQKQSRGLAQAQEKNRKECDKWLKELKPPQLQAKHKQLQKSLDGASRQYAAMAKRAEQAAQKGNTKQLESYRKSLQRLAGAMDRQAKDGQAGTRLWKQTDDALRAISKEADEQQKSQKESSKHAKRKTKSEKKSADNAEQAADNARQSAEAEKEVAANAKKAADAKKQQADAAKKAADAAKQKEQQQEVKIQQLNGELSAVRAAMGKMEAEHGKVASSISQLAGAMQSCAAAAGQTAAAASGAASAAARAVSNLQQQIKNIQKQIDRINRKL